jgi:protein-S-isoprenylcysteine O-methyltransferase Ste14
MRRWLRQLPVPPGQVTGVLAVTVLGRVRPARLPGRSDVHRATGSVLLLAGAGIIARALAERARRATGPFDLERPEFLVTTGPYRLTRHPMYVGWWLLHLGLGLLQGSAWVLATLPAAILAEHTAVVAEEADLLERFGGEFQGYAARVRRYL